MKFRILLLSIFFCVSTSYADSAHKNSSTVRDSLAFSASKRCKKTDETGRQQEINESESFEIADCFLNTDYWWANDTYTSRENIAGTGTGLALACTRELNYKCSRSFQKAGVLLNNHNLITALKTSPGDVVTGFGANSQDILLSLDYDADSGPIFVEGHSTVIYYQENSGNNKRWWQLWKSGENSLCISLDHFNNCMNLAD